MRPTFEPYQLTSKLIAEGTNNQNEFNDTVDMATKLDGSAMTGTGLTLQTM
jgi:hypothetical protein